MKEIMEQDSQRRTSNLSLELSRQGGEGGPRTDMRAVRISQKERKRLQRDPSVREHALPVKMQQSSPIPESASPWNSSSSSKQSNYPQRPTANATKLEMSRNDGSVRSASPLNMRQTIAKMAPPGKDSPKSAELVKSTASNITHTPQASPSPRTATSAVQRPTSSSSSPPSRIQSIQHIVRSRPAEQTYQLSIADIVSQQQAEKDFVKEAAAKRSLQDIQQEQEFQEWWDQESKKVMAEEAAAARAAERSAKGPRDRGSRKGARGVVRQRGRGKGRDGSPGPAKGGSG
jgi:inhibitor of Bruton tyrosine kinase